MTLRDSSTYSAWFQSCEVLPALGSLATPESLVEMSHFCYL